MTEPAAAATAPSEAGDRDNFSPGTIDLLAKRAGYMCAFPGCRRLTVGPSEDRATETTMVGVAAHITAASKRGPRYDPSLSSAERSSERNGVWMCQTHGKLIDDNPSKHSVEEISRWKKQHEEWVFARVSNAENLLTDGISAVRLKEVGPFGDRVTVKLGRHNVVYGPNNAGKSTLCEAIAAFSGRANYNRFAHRWDFCRGSPRDIEIEAVASHRDAATLVSLSQQNLPIRRRIRQPQRLRIEVDGSIAASWPRALFNVVRISSAAKMGLRSGSHTQSGF
jgi:AAA domain